MNNAGKQHARLGLFLAALLFSTGGAAIKATTLSIWQVAGFRSGVAALALCALMPGARRGWSWRTLLIGTAYAATLILFVAANKLTTSANAIFLQSVAPAYLLFLAPLLLKEPVRRRDAAVMAGVFAGLLLLMSGSETVARTAPNPHLGNLYGIASSLAWALTLVGLRWMGKHSREDAGLATVAAGNLIVFAACLPMALPLSSIGTKDVAAVLYLGIFQIALAYFFLTRSLRCVQGLEASMLLMVEPVFNPVWTWLIHGERPSLAAIGGGALILGAALASAGGRAASE